jgi:DNA-directed RNA polymerase specialized sigma24 family protein
LERRYRRLLLVYPAGYRQRRADEIVGTFLDTAAAGQTRPTLADVTDLLAGGLRQRAGLDADLEAGWALAGPVALALAAGLAGFLWLSVEPLFGTPRGYAAPGAYAAWLLALAGWVGLPGRYARWPVALAVAVTALIIPVTAVTGDGRPPLWVVLALLGFGGLGLAAAPPKGFTIRLGVLTGALVTAAVAKSLLAGRLLETTWKTGYYQPVLSLAGLVVAAAVVAVAAGGVLAAVEGRRARPWLWAALLLALPGGWLGPRGTGVEPGTRPGFGRLAEVLLATCVVLAAMAALSRVRGRPHPAGALSRAGGVALGCAAGLAGFLWVGEIPGYGWGPTRGPWAYGAWLVAALAWPVLPAIGRRIAVGAALSLTVIVALSLPGAAQAALFTLALLGIVALLGSAGSSSYPLPVALVTLAAAAAITSYDNGWRLTVVEAFPHTAALVLTVAIVPFTLAALAGARALNARGYRIPASLLILTGTGWVGTLTLPYVADWGPILLLIPLAAMAITVLLAVRSRRARLMARRALAQGRHGALLALANEVSADPEGLVVAVLAEAYRQGGVNEARLRARLVRAALRQPPRAGSDPISLAVQGLPPDQRIALGLRFGAELSTVDIAALLGVPHATICTLLKRGTDALSGALGGDCGVTMI